MLTYELLAGHLPFESADAGVLREVVLKETAPGIEGLAGGAWAALGRGLAKGREERYGSCREFVEAVEGGKAEIRKPKTENRNQKHESRRWRWWCYWRVSAVGISACTCRR